VHDGSNIGGTFDWQRVFACDTLQSYSSNCCSMLQCVAVRCSVWQCVAACHSAFDRQYLFACDVMHWNHISGAACCSVSQCVAVRSIGSACLRIAHRGSFVYVTGLTQR